MFPLKLQIYNHACAISSVNRGVSVGVGCAALESLGASEFESVFKLAQRKINSNRATRD